MSKIKAMLEEIRPEFDFAESEDYIADGYLDSFDIVSLVAMLDKEYHISIKGTDITPENFASIVAIQAMLKRYDIDEI